jgi:hypothetical protein
MRTSIDVLKKKRERERTSIDKHENSTLLITNILIPVARR